MPRGQETPFMTVNDNAPPNGAAQPPSPGFTMKTGLRFLVRNWEEIISCIGMCVIIGVISLNVGLRYFFNASIAWAEEVSVIGFSCVIFIGSAVVFKRHMHVGIDFAVNLLPGPARAALNYVTSVFVILFCAYITYLGWIFSIEAWNKPTHILFLPYFFVNIPICLGFASMTFYGVRDLVLRHRKRNEANVTQRFREGGI